MNGMFNYIFDSMKNADMAIRNISKTLNRQKKFNHNVVVLAIATTVYIAVTESRISDLTKKIEKAEKELASQVEKEVENAKGE